MPQLAQLWLYVVLREPHLANSIWTTERSSFFVVFELSVRGLVCCVGLDWARQVLICGYFMKVSLKPIQYGLTGLMPTVNNSDYVLGMIFSYYSIMF